MKKEDLQNLKLGDVLYHINPYSRESQNQHQVQVEEYVILENDGERLTFSVKSSVSNEWVVRSNFINDLLFGCKFNTKVPIDAVVAIMYVTSGFCSDDVEKYHSSVDNIILGCFIIQGDVMGCKKFILYNEGVV